MPSTDKKSYRIFYFRLRIYNVTHTHPEIHTNLDPDTPHTEEHPDKNNINGFNDMGDILKVQSFKRMYYRASF